MQFPPSASTGEHAYSTAVSIEDDEVPLPSGDEEHAQASPAAAESEDPDAPLGLMRPRNTGTHDADEDDDPLALSAVAISRDHRVEKDGAHIDPDDMTRLPMAPARGFWDRLFACERSAVSQLVLGAVLGLLALWVLGSLVAQVLGGGRSLPPEARLAVKSSYRVLLVGDSLTEGMVRGQDSHPYRLNLERLLQERYPYVTFTFETDVQSGECVSDKCRSKSLHDRVTDRLHPGGKPAEFIDLAIVLGGTNDILRDFSAAQITAALSTIHWMLWTQPPPALVPSPDGEPGEMVPVPFTSPKTLMLSIPQMGSDDNWRPEGRASRQSDAAEIRGDVNAHMEALCRKRPAQCTFVNLERKLPRWGLGGLPYDDAQLQRMWSDDIHPSAEGYDELGRIIFNAIRPLMPDTN